MNQIIMGKPLMNKVLSGEKCQTIRKWNKKTSIKVGDEVNLFNFREKLPVTITAIYEKNMRDLTLQEAIDDGYESIEQLREAIKRFYDDQDFIAIIIKFKPVSGTELNTP